MNGANTFLLIQLVNQKRRTVKSDTFSCGEARQIDLVDYLARMGTTLPKYGTMIIGIYPH